MKKKILIFSVIFSFLIVLFFATWIYVSRSTQKNMYADPAAEYSKTIMPLDSVPYMMTATPGLRFKFDTGADISTLSDADAELLRSLGYSVKESFGPIIGRDGYGLNLFSMKRYTVDLPIGGYEILEDSISTPVLKYTGKPASILRNVDFAQCGHGISTIGLDLLSKFKIEYYCDIKAVGFSEAIPFGCVRVTNIKKNVNLFDFLWSPNRSYLIASVDQTPEIYFMDTGIQRTSIKRPLRDKQLAKHGLRTDSIHTLIDVVPAYVDDDSWVDFGSRSGTKRVYYYDNSEEEYQLNPFNLFTHNLLIDISGSTVYLLPD